jgi:hypothetical protein
MEGIDREAGIVGKGGQLCRFGGGDRLDPGIGMEAVAGLLGLFKAKLAGRARFDAMRRQQFAHFGELPGIVGGDHELAGDSAVVGHAHI